ncbi:MAG: type II secretion system F family protein, partial [Deltaproteobacteria bacterium]|nr:type II secretion system F family protein [Deltaproteobacteria bacterium]
MPSFSYQAINEAGKAVSGVIEADTVDLATNIIVARGYIPSKVKEQVKGSAGISISALNKRLVVVKAPELIMFTRQFRTMLKAGVPMIRLLQVLENQTEN